MRQDYDRAIYDFLAIKEVIWNKLTLCQPILKHPSDTKMYDDDCNHTRLIQ